jgi:hypothetical protein
MKNYFPIQTSAFQFGSSECVKNYKRFGRELAFSIFCCLSLFCTGLLGQGNMSGGSAPLPSIPGLPQGVSVQESYRRIANFYYALPTGKSIIDYNDFDKITMRNYVTDDRYFYFEDASGKLVTVKQVLNANEQFLPQVMPYEYLVIHGQEVTFFDRTMDTIYSLFSQFEHEFEETDGTDMYYQGDGDGDAPGTDLEGTWEELPHGFRYVEPGFEWQFNENNGIYSSTTFDEMGQWQVKKVEVIDMNDPGRSVPIFEISISRDVLPSEECVFQVLMQRYSEYFRAVSNEEPESELRSSGESELELQLQAIKVWPNPVKDFIFVQIPEIEGANQIELRIIGMDGRQKLVQNVNTNSYERIGLENYESGLYIVHFLINGVSHFDKIFIQ